MTHKIAQPDEIIFSKIYVIREQKVMIDRDLAVLYGIETKRLKEAVRRNKERFPEDFMFEMSKEELATWRAGIQISHEDKQGLRYSPFCFTEQGVTMLSCVLNSPTAIQVNIRIMRVYARLREMVLTHKDILLKLEQLENKVSQNSSDIEMVFSALKQLLNPEQPQRQRIGFKVGENE